MRRISVGRRIFFGLLALLVFLLAVEAALRTVGWVYLKKARADFGANDSPTILCLGDSFTYGIGAGVDAGYPAHLGRLLGENWRVINGGHPYMDSSSLRTIFSEQVLAAKPRAVVVLVGYNNQFKASGEAIEESPFQQTFRSFFKHFRLAELIRIGLINRSVDVNTRVAAEIPPLSYDELLQVRNNPQYAPVEAVFARHDGDHKKVIEDPATDPDTLLAKGLAYLVEGEGRLAEPLFFQVLKQRPDDQLALMGASYITVYRREIVVGFVKARFQPDEAWLRTGMALVLFEMNRYQDAIAMLTGLIKSLEEQDNRVSWYGDSFLYLARFHLRAGNPGEALVDLERLEGLEPWRADLFWLRGEALLELGDWPGAERAFDSAFHNGMDHPSYYGRLRRMLAALPADPDAALAAQPTAAAVAPSKAVWRRFVTYARARLADQSRVHTALNLEADLLEMLTICRNLNIEIILMSYPDRFSYSELRDFATLHNVPFVDNVAVFEEALTTMPPHELFQPDGHCTAAGYLRMAEAVRQTLARNGIVTEGATP